MHFLFKSHKPNNSKGYGGPLHMLCSDFHARSGQIRCNEIWIMGHF